MNEQPTEQKRKPGRPPKNPVPSKEEKIKLPEVDKNSTTILPINSVSSESENGFKIVTQPPIPQDPFREEFEEFKKSVIDILEKMHNKEEVKSEAKPELKDAPIEITQSGFLPPHYQKIFDNYFDAEDGFEAKLDFPEQDANSGEKGGLTFTIKVADKLSNITPAQRDFYKIDLRTVALQPNNIAKGIDDWCKKVANNLKYSKKFKFK